MNWPELLLGALVGAVIGVALNEVVPGYITALRARHASRAAAKRRALFTSGAVHEWLVAYYTTRGLQNELYNCRFGRYEAKIPFLTKDDWIARAPGIDPDSVVRWSVSDPVTFPVDNALIDTLQREGKTFVGNQRTMYLDRLEEQGPYLRLHLKACSYYAMVTRLAAFERETVSAAARGFTASSGIRDSCFSSLRQAIGLPSKPFSAGCVTVIAVRNGNSWDVLLQTRSHKTITYGGFKCGIPTFGLEPILPPPEHVDPDVVTFNVLREYCEELFSYDQLIEQGRTRHIDPYWFYALPEAKELLGALSEGSATLSYLGFGFDALNGTATMGVLMTVTSPPVIERLRRKVSPNWEVAESVEDDRAIEFVDIRSPRLEQWLRERRIHAGAAFTLSQAVARLQQR